MIHFRQQLIQDGEDFHDLTMLFRDVERPLYSDNCCHLNKDGYLLVVDKLVKILEKEGSYADLLQGGRCVPGFVEGVVRT